MIRRLILKLQIWNLQILIASRDDVMRMVGDKMTLANMELSQLGLQAELRRLQAELMK